MMQRTLMLIAAAGVVVWTAAFPPVAAARVVVAEIERVIFPDNTPYATRNSTELLLKPLKVEAIKGNPVVTFRVYMADGLESDPARFREMHSHQVIFSHYEVAAGVAIGWRLDTSKIYISFYNSLRAIPGGVHSIFITADDGTGECPPSNIMTFELMPDPGDVFQPPVITGIRSPAPGIVAFTVNPVVYSGRGDPTRLLSVYHSDGRQLDYSLFTGIGTRFGPTGVYDSTSVTAKTPSEIVVVGLKSGETSFHIRLQLEFGSWVKWIASNILTVSVAGTAREEGSMVVYMNPLTTLGVGGEAKAGEGLHLYPNPADRAINLHAPFSGRACVRVFDLLGAPVAAHDVILDDGFVSLDISGLRAGRYVAAIESGGRFERAGFIIVR